MGRSKTSRVWRWQLYGGGEPGVEYHTTWRGLRPPALEPYGDRAVLGRSGASAALCQPLPAFGEKGRCLVTDTAE